MGSAGHGACRQRSDASDASALVSAAKRRFRMRKAAVCESSGGELVVHPRKWDGVQKQTDCKLSTNYSTRAYCLVYQASVSGLPY